FLLSAENLLVFILRGLTKALNRTHPRDIRKSASLHHAHHSHHHLLHLIELFDELVHFCDCLSSTLGNSATARPVDEVHVLPFLLGHGINDDAHLLHFCFGRPKVTHLTKGPTHSWNHLKDGSKRTQAVNSFHLLHKIIDGEFSAFKVRHH